MAISSLLNYVSVQNGNHELITLPEGVSSERQINLVFQGPPATAPAVRIEPSQSADALKAERPDPASPLKISGQTRQVATLNDLVKLHRNDSGHQALATREKFDHHITVAARYLDFDRAVTSIRLADMRELKSKLSEGRKPSTVNDILWKGLGPLFRLAVEDELIEKSPLEKLKRARKGEPERNQPTWEQAQLIEDEVGRYAEETAIIVGMIRNFGVGQAEIQHLQGEHIDIAQQVIHFRRKKTGKPFDVPVFPHAKEFVERLRSDGRLKQGQPVVQWRNPRKALQSACERLNLSPYEPRAIRRTFIVHALQNAIDPRVVARWQGHKDATLIFKVYGKYIDANYERQQAEKLDQTASAEKIIRVLPDIESEQAENDC